MQRLSDTKQDSNKRHGDLLQVESRCLVGICRMQIHRRYRAVLVLLSAWPIGGAVEPPCDFLSEPMGMSLNKGSPGRFPSRSAGGGVRACAYGGLNPYAARQNFPLFIKKQP